MRLFAFLVLLIFSASFALARDIVTLTGKTYRGVTVTAVLGNGIKIIHNDGAAFVDFKELPEQLKKEFGYSPEAYATATVTYQQQGVVLQQAQQRAVAQEREKNLADELRRVEARATAAEQTAADALAKAAQLEAVNRARGAETIASRDYSLPRYSSSSYSTRDYSTPRYTGGTVSVRGYYRKDGTYVRPHTRKR